MTLREQFKKETGKRCDVGGEKKYMYFTDEYVEWLEKKLESANTAISSAMKHGHGYGDFECISNGDNEDCPVCQYAKENLESK